MFFKKKKKNNYDFDEKDIKQGEERLKQGLDEAEELLKDKDRLDKFLESAEKKIKLIPFGGSQFAVVPIFIQMIRSYANREYKEVPTGTILAMISATAYFLSPVDFIPDFIPFLGKMDDAAVVAACLRWVNSDLDDYKLWRDTHKK